jgi:hypothetical protein
VAALRHWRVYAVDHPAPIATGNAELTTMNGDSMTLHARTAGITVIRVRFSPYWAVAGGAGCVSPGPDGAFTRVTVGRRGVVRLVMRFSPARIASEAMRCTSSR